MRLKIKVFILALAIIEAGILFRAPFAFTQEKQEEFIYDAKGKRDPFIPLLDKDSSTGLRKSFVSPKLEVKLPLEIKVSGILWNGKEYFAIINDKVMQEGAGLNNIKLKKIEKDKVILEYEEREFTVFLKGRKEK